MADCEAYDDTTAADISDEEPLSAPRNKKKKEYADFVTGLHSLNLCCVGCIFLFLWHIVILFAELIYVLLSPCKMR